MGGFMRQPFGPLVTCEELHAHLEDPDWVILDCRHDLGDPKVGPAAYEAGHIPGSIFAHIDHDLSSEVGDGMEGRHPLPDPDRLRAFLSEAGVDEKSRVVAYDDVGGAWAGRAWWLLRHYGHQAVAVLDGGLQQWNKLDLPLREGVEKARRRGRFLGKVGHMPVLDATRIETEIGQVRGAYQVVDARAAERYRGEDEPMDPVAGHIPGSINIPFAGNLDGDGRFLSPDALRDRYEDALGVQEVGRVVVYCGSGVTAAHDILAMEVAGLGTAALYPGGWSAWCQPDAERPVDGPQEVEATVRSQ